MGAMKEFAGLYYREGALDPKTLMYAMRGAARATWSTIKYIPGVEDLNKDWKTTFEREQTK